MQVRIINGTDFGGFYTDEFIANNPDIVQGWDFTEVEPNSELIKPIWNGSEWIEGATEEEIEAYQNSLVPKDIPRMKFIIQVFLSTGIKYEDIVLFIQNLNFDEAQKYVILTRLRGCTHFERYSSDLLTIAQLMGITEAQLNHIFINGNQIT